MRCDSTLCLGIGLLTSNGTVSGLQFRGSRLGPLRFDRFGQRAWPRWLRLCQPTAERRLLLAMSRSRLLGLLPSDDIRAERVLGFRHGRGLRFARRLRFLDLLAFHGFGCRLRLGCLCFHRTFEVLSLLVTPLRLVVLGNDSGLPGFRRIVLGKQNVEDAFENIQFDGSNEQDGMEEETKDDRQLHAATEDPIVDESQSSRHAAQADCREHQPRDGVRVPTRIVKPQISDDRAHNEATQHTECQEHRPKLIVERLPGGRFQLADNASDFRHDATL